MTILVNGQQVDIREAATVRDLLEARGIRPERVAVAVNGVVTPRSTWSQAQLQANDHIELVRAVSGGADVADDPLEIAGVAFRSRLFLGTGRFPSPQVLRDALLASGTELVTLSIRAMGLDGMGADGGLVDELDLTKYRLLPNTAGAISVRQAVYMAHLAREATSTNWIKLEVIGDERTLWPDPDGTVEACRQLTDEGFFVLAYTSADLVTALHLEQAGAAAIMPLAAMIGSGQGLRDGDPIRRIVERVDVPVVVDAGIGVPSDAAASMELGAAACLVNTAISRAGDPVTMAHAMRLGVEAGRLAYLAGRMARLDYAVPSSPVDGVVEEPSSVTSKSHSPYIASRGGA